MRILAFAASNSRQSINRAIVGYASRLLEDGLIGDAKVDVIDLNDYEMPIYSIDREIEGGIPPQASDFLAKIGAADGVIISFAEHNGLYTVAYKNIFDWASRAERRVYQNKPAVLFATSIGKGGGANALSTAVRSGTHFGQNIIASLAIPSFNENFDLERGSIVDPALDDQFRAALATLVDDRPEPSS